jgi:hypothetical protein
MERRILEALLFGRAREYGNPPAEDILPACIELPTNFAFVSSQSGVIVLERGPTVVDVRYRLEAYGTLLFGLAREV